MSPDAENSNSQQSAARGQEILENLLARGGYGALTNEEWDALADLLAERYRYRETLKGIANDTQRTVAGLQGWARATLNGENYV